MNHFRCYFLPFFLCTPHRVAAVWGHHCCIFPFRFLYTLSFWGKVRTAAGALRSPYPLLHGSHYSAMFKLSCLNMLGYLQTYGFELEHLRCFLCSRSCCFFQKKKKNLKISFLIITLDLIWQTKKSIFQFEIVVLFRYFHCYYNALSIIILTVSLHICGFHVMGIEGNKIISHFFSFK